MTTDLTQEQKRELSMIVNDKYSFGSFAGMLTNLQMEHGCSYEHALKIALTTRLQMKEDVKVTLPKPPTTHSK